MHLRTAVRGLEEFSHLWLVFIFHRHDARNWKPSIRPPRLGGAKKVGVLASRSPHRPNPIGLSAVKIERIDLDAEGGPEIHVSGVDILDGTPLLDIKPYIPYADSIPAADAGWATEPILRTPVSFSEQAHSALSDLAGEDIEKIKGLITEVLELDPRPAFQKRKLPSTLSCSHGTSYGFSLLEYDVKWVIHPGIFLVTDIVRLDSIP